MVIAQNNNKNLDTNLIWSLYEAFTELYPTHFMRVRHTVIARKNFDLSTSLATLDGDNPSIDPALHVILLKGYMVFAI